MFSDTPTHVAFRVGIIGTLFGVLTAYAVGLELLVCRAIEEQDEWYLCLARKIADTGREWTVQDVEERLGVTLEIASLAARRTPG